MAEHVDYFLKLDDVKGESHDSKHKGEIDILSFSWGVTQMAHGTGGGGGAGKSSLQDLHFTHHMDKASATLFKLSTNGKHIKTGTLICRKAGEHPLEYLKIEMKDILVTSVQWSGGGGEVVPTESFSLNFAHVKTTYTPQKADGSGDVVADFDYDIKASKMS